MNIIKTTVFAAALALTGTAFAGGQADRFDEALPYTPSANQVAQQQEPSNTGDDHQMPGTYLQVGASSTDNSQACVDGDEKKKG